MELYKDRNVELRKYIIPLCFLFSAESVIAETYSPVSTIKGMTVGTTLVRVFLADVDVLKFESCTVEAKKTGYALNPADTGVELMLSTLLSAKVSGQKLMFQSVGCHAGYSEISHIYFCDTEFCK